MQAHPWFARFGLAAIGSSEPVTTSPPPSVLIARYTLTPGVGVGPLEFGDRVVDHHELEPRYGRPGSIFDFEQDYAEYTIAGLEDVLIVYADREGRIDSVGFYEHCLIDGRELIGMGVGELLVLLGLPSAIEAEQVGREIELIYAYDALGLTVWTIDGEVCVVQAGSDSDTES
jgi:hypothetical protein